MNTKDSLDGNSMEIIPEINLENESIDIADIINEVEQLATNTVNNNSFPIEVFPGTVQEIITETNSSLKFPIDFIGSSLLYASSLGLKLKTTGRKAPFFILQLWRKQELIKVIL